nr:MAG TPA: hypothetical protein [Caudoviricetes sp.]
MSALMVCVVCHRHNVCCPHHILFDVNDHHVRH